MARPARPYRVVPVTTGDEEPRFYPELVAAFQAIGFRRLGGVTERFHTDADRDELVAAFAPEHRPAMELAIEAPETLLVAPDGTAFVGVDWFWQQPSVRVRTLLTDGTLVETQRAWDHLPVWPEGADRALPHLRLPAEQDRRGRGRRFTIVAGDDMAGLWTVHQSAVASSRSSPRAHETIDQAARLFDQLADHDSRAESRAITLGLPVALHWRFRYAAWLRPRFRGDF